MRTFLAFGAGFATGWLTRSALGSFRELVVGSLATGHGLIDRIRHAVEVEREFLEDLFAEARARHPRQDPAPREGALDPEARPSVAAAS
jgi:hypothetical protein